MKSRIEKAICVILSFILMINMIIIPTTRVVAASDSSKADGSTAITLASILDADGYLTDDALINLDRLPYVEDKFTELTDNGDGTKTLKVFNSPIKYKNDQDEWVAIDNSITLAESAVTGQMNYKNGGSDVAVLLSDNLDQESAISMAFDDYSIGFKPIGILKTDGKSSAEVAFVEAVDKNSKEEKEQKDSTFDTASDYASIEYAKTFDENTNIKITPNATGIKEDVILYAVPTATEFSYELQVKNAVPVLRQDGNVYFVDLEKGLIVAAIASPFMYDSAAEYHESGNVAVKLEKISDNKYKYTMIPDRVFFEDKTTQYPVFLDPSVTVTGLASEDTFITSLYPNNSYNNDASLKIGYSPTWSKSRGLIKSAIPSSLTGLTINAAYYCAYQDYSGTSSPLMDIHYMTNNWDSATAKWANYTNGLNGGLAMSGIYTQQYVSTIGWYYFNITSLAQSWCQLVNPLPNYGICLKNNNEGINYYKRFRSNLSSISNGGNYFSYTFTDTTPPPLPVTFSASSNFSGPTGSVTVGWSAVTDLPTNYASGINRYEVAMLCNGVWNYANVSASTLSHTFTNVPDNTELQFAVRAHDNNGNVLPDYKRIYGYLTPDKTGPEAPASFTVTPATRLTPTPAIWTSNTTPTLAWSGMTDEGNHLAAAPARAEYQIDSTSGAWTPIGTNYGIASGAYTFSTPAEIGLSDGAHTIYLRGVDSVGNVGATASCTYNKDTTAPSVSITVSDPNPDGIVQINATVGNEGGSDFGNWVLEYGPGNPATSYVEPALRTGTMTLDNQMICDWDTSDLADNTYYTLRLTVTDALGNTDATTLTLLKANGSVAVNAGLQINQPSAQTENDDGFQPEMPGVSENAINDPSTPVTFEKDGDGGTTGLSYGYLYVNNHLHDYQSDLSDLLTFNPAAYGSNGWVYPEGSMAYLYVQAKDATEGELYSTGTMAALQIADSFDNVLKSEHYSQATIQDSAAKLSTNDGLYYTQGSFESITKPFAGDISYVDLTVDQIVPATASILYEISVDNGTSWQSITPVSTDGGVTTDLANRKYFGLTPQGDSVKTRATLTKATSGNLTPIINSWSVDVRYTTYANAVLVDNSFPANARGITNLVQTAHDQTTGSIKLAANPYFYSSGSIQSTLRYTSNDVIEACLEVEQNVPENTSITYYISTQSGADGTWYPITPGDASDLDDWATITDPGTQIVIKAEMTGNGLATPELLSWRLAIKEKIAGQPYLIKLVDEPWNLSTLTGANYMTLLRWEASTTDNVTYNVYRSTTPYFVPSAATLAAEGLTETSWNDYNLNYGQTFYYQVTAVLNIDGHARESLPSNQAWATIVSESEIDKRLGLQNYWSFTGFKTGSGTGYVNVSNGNMAYITTDMVLSDPFFATVMRRTFNSMADTKTAMGYGWDYSFNTCLMKEYDGSTETGMVLKDGDGSFHQFAKNTDGTYQSANGTFMALTYDEALDEYQIRRKDNIIYHYDAQSMKLKRFTDNNNNELRFTYDVRGNLAEVENTVGEKMTLQYYVEGVASDNSDYTYVNYNPDMLKSVTWTENTETDPVTTIYNYEYDELDRLNRAYTIVENNTVYEETFNYDPITGEMATISDPMDNVTTISYGPTGRVDQITDANNDYYNLSYGAYSGGKATTTITNNYGVNVSYEYNNNGLVTKKTDALGHNIEYTHNSDYLVDSVSYQNTVNGGTTPVTISSVITYDDNGNPLTITGSDGSVTTYSGYNSFNKPQSVSVSKAGRTLTTTYTYDASGNLLTSTDPEGKVSINSYTTVNGNAGYLTQVENDFGGQTRYTYDSKGRVTQVDAFINGTFQNIIAVYGYECNVDDYFMRVTATDAMGNSTKTFYDKLGRTAEVLYADGKHVTANHDLVGNVLEQTDRAGYSVTYAYDDLYRMTDAFYPDGSTNSIQYLKWDSDGIYGNEADLVVKIDGTGVRNLTYYDKAGRTLKTSVSDGTTAITTAQYEYDMIGNCTKVTDNAGRVSEARYNELGQTMKTIVDPTGEAIETSFTYDMMGNKLTVTNGEGNTTSYNYDDDSRLLGVTQIANSATLTTSYAYDIEEDSVIKNRTTDANGHVTETWFDALGRKIKDINIGDTADSIVMQTSYTYNANGQVSIVTRNDGTKEKYTYNSLGQATRVDYYTATEDTALDSDDYLVYQYYDSGNLELSSVYHPSSEESTGYSYDEMGRVSQMVQGDLQNGGLSINYAYDLASRVTQISYCKDTTTKNLGYTYDSLGRIHSITLALGSDTPATVREYLYKANGDLDSVKNYREFETDGLDYIQTAYEMNSAGLTTKITYTDYSYDNGTMTATKTEEYTMTYDDNGNIKTETGYTNYGTPQTVNKGYDYDTLGRLTQATIGSQTKTYGYDNVGNRTSVSEGTDNYGYSYNQFNQLTTINKNNATYTSYEYDGRGNQTQENQRYLSITVGTTTTLYDKTTNYEYDLSNQLTTLSSSTPTANAQGEVSYLTQSTQNKYNAAGQRVSRDVENEGITKYYYSGSATLYTTNANNLLLTENILDLGGSIVASLRFADQYESTPDPYANQYFFYNYDMRGSTTAIIQPDGTLIKGYSYDEFGALEQSGATDFLNEVTFTGSVTDTSSGLQYMNARFYSPATGRFLSQDTYTGNASEPWTQHLYSYCGNNPVNMIDPTGHIAIRYDDGGGASTTRTSSSGRTHGGGGRGDTSNNTNKTSTYGDRVSKGFEDAAPLFAGSVAAAVLDGPAPFGDAAAVIFDVVLAAGICIGAIWASDNAGSLTIPYTSSYPLTLDDADVDEAVDALPQPPRNPNDIHHIVAQTAKAAIPAQEILKGVGIDPVTAGVNLVPVPRSYHQRMHTMGPIGYYSYVNYRLAPCAGNRALVEATLKELSAEIIAYSEINKVWPGIIDASNMFD